MGGYKRPAKTYRLVFEDPEFEGLVVRARSVPLGQFMQLSELADLDPEGQLDVEAMAQVDKVFRLFAGALVDWNLETEDGEPVPATVEGLYTQDLDFALAIISAWAESIGSVAGPLAKRSKPGGTFPEESLPMELLSTSQAS